MDFTITRMSSGARRVSASLLLSVVAIALFWIPGAAPLLEYDRAGIAGGEIWRAVTGHWTHASGEHLVWDVVVFALLGGFLQVLAPRRFWPVLVASALAIPLAIAVLQPDLATYRGLSGLDCALFVAVSWELLRAGLRNQDHWQVRLAGGLLLTFAAKVLFESCTGSTLFVSGETGSYVPVPLAHLIGGISGFLACTLTPGNLSGRIPTPNLEIQWWV